MGITMAFPWMGEWVYISKYIYVYIYIYYIKSPLATFYGSSLSLSFHPHFITHIYKIGVSPSDEPNLRRVKGVQPESHCDVTGRMVNTGIAAYHPFSTANLHQSKSHIRTSTSVPCCSINHNITIINPICFVSTPVVDGFRHGVGPFPRLPCQEPLQFAGAARDASVRPFWRPGRGATSQIQSSSRWPWLSIETHGFWLADPPF